MNAVTRGGKVVPELPEYLDTNTTNSNLRIFPIFHATLPPDLTFAASLRAAEALFNQADQLVQSGFQAISQAFPGSMPTDPHRENLCMRDLHYYLRPIIVCCQLESTVPLDNFFLLQVKEINSSLGYNNAWFVTFYQSIKANHGLSGEEAVIANRYLDYAIKELS